MAIPMSEFEAVRLERDARSAGEAFGFDDTDTDAGDDAVRATTIWWLAGAAAVAGLIGYSLL